MSNIVAKHQMVEITYLIKDDKGEAIEQNDIPVSYVHGAKNELLEVLENALDGKQVGDVVEVVVPPEEGFGLIDPEMTFTDDIENVPEEYRYVGAHAQFQNDDGESKTFIVSKIEDGQLTLDGNHPFAGKTVTFVVNVKSIRAASEEEIANGRPLEPYGMDMIEPPPAGRH